MITHFFRSRAFLIWNQLTSTLVLTSHISNQAETNELGDVVQHVVYDAPHCANWARVFITELCMNPRVGENVLVTQPLTD